MTTKAKASKGTKISIGDGATTEVFAEIGEVLSFKAPPVEVPTIDVTQMSDSNRQHISTGVVDNGECTFDVSFSGIDAQHQQLRTDAKAGTLRNFKLELNDAVTTQKTTFSFAAFITKLDGPNAGIGEQYKAAITLKVSGAVTFTPAS